jgi:hypothetical protein
MALIAAKHAHKPDPSQRVAVAIGTGMGCMGAAGTFIQNQIALDEREPMPALFPGSVHNAAAGQVAMDQDAQALNSAPTTGEISFECALWQAMRQLANDEADCALAGSVDELNKYLLSIGKRWGMWTETTRPGEAAVVACLVPSKHAIEPLATVARVRLGRYRRPFEAAREVDWIANTVDLAGVDVLLSGAGGFPALNPFYDGVAKEFAKRSPNRVEHQTYKQLCGEFHSASAFGFSVAVDLVRRARKRVLLYTLSVHGSKALCLLQP